MGVLALHMYVVYVCGVLFYIEFWRYVYVFYE